MKIKYLSIIALSLALFAISCKKDKTTGPSNKDLANRPADVYVAGYVNMNINGSSSQAAAYWKNGVLTILGDTTSSASFISLARGIAVSGSDVYVAGVVYTQNYGYAIMWKNGVPIKLSPDSTASEATGITVSGNDVYVTGFIHDIVVQNGNGTQYSSNPVYWKNGVPYKIPNATAINSIFVNGSDVYIGGAVKSGHKYNDTGYGMGSKAAYWKNGSSIDSLNSVADDEPYYSSAISHITANSTGVYAVGASQIYPPEMWINDTPVALSGGTTSSTTTAIMANGTDVYVSGSTFYNGNDWVAAYWKNNVPTFLQTDLPINATVYSEADGIALYGSDVYVAGTAYVQFVATPTGGAYVWKNAVYTKLPDRGKGAFATSIAVAPQP